MPLSEFKSLGAKERPRRNYGTWEPIIRKIKGIESEPSPVDLYPFVSSKTFDPALEAERFKKFGMKPEQYPSWFKDLTSTRKSED